MSEPMYPAPPPPGPPPAAPPPMGGPPASRPGLPWERSKDLGALVETAKLLITAPAQAYAMAKEKGDYASPLLFAVIFAVIGSIFSSLWQMIFGPANWMKYMSDVPPEMREMMGGGAMGVGRLLVGIVLTPIIIIIALFIWSGIVHLVLSLLKALNDSTAGFEGTFRALAYSSVAQLATIVPLFGGLIGGIWGLVLGMFGLVALHRTTQGKALGGLLIPLAVCCCLGIALMVMMGAAIGAAISGMNN